jgi:hypothetical protein
LRVDQPRTQRSAAREGELADQYVASPDQVPERLGQMDLKRDPDGRFRVNDA